MKRSVFNKTSINFIFYEHLFGWEVNPASSWESYKTNFLEAILGDENIVKLIIKKIEDHLTQNFPTATESDKNEDNILLLQKLMISLKNFTSTPKEDEDNIQINEEEIEYLLKSLQFVVSGKFLTFENEKNKISQSLIQKYDNIQIILNLQRGFDGERIEEPIQQEHDPAFKCSTHSTNDATHFCLTDKKFVCGFDTVQDDDSKEDSCKNHHLVPISSYQTTLENSLKESNSKIQSLITNLKTRIVLLDQQSKKLIEKQQNDEKCEKILEELSQRMNIIISLEQSSISSKISYSPQKLDEMMKIEKEFSENFPRAMNGRNEKEENISGSEKKLQIEIVELRKELENEKNKMISKSEKKKKQQSLRASVCMKHREKITYYCSNCNKLVCAHDMKENCLKHSDKVISLQEYQSNLGTLASQHVLSLKEQENELKNQIQNLEQESNLLISKREKNDVTRTSVSEFVVHIEEILKIESKEQLEQLIQIEEEFEEKFKNIPIEKDEKVEQIAELHSKNDKLEKKNCELKSELEISKNQIIELKSEKQEEIKKLQEHNQKYKTISISQLQILRGFVEQSIGNHGEWKLASRFTEDGFSAASFHGKCDQYQRTITIVKTTNGSIFGGFTTHKWNEVGYVRDDNAFIFTLFCPNQPNRSPARFSPTIKPEAAIYCSPSYGPTFGGYDIHISDNSNQNLSSHACYSKANNNYQANFSDDNACQTYLCGSRNFQTSEIEIYTM